MEDPWATSTTTKTNTTVSATSTIITTNDDESNDYLSHLREKPVKKPKLPSVASLATTPAVKISHAGASYNPTFTDHQAVLQLALNVELEKEAKKESIGKQLSYPPELDLLDDEDFFESDEEADSTAAASAEADADNTDPAPHSKKPDGVRKTKSQRNKEAARSKREKEEAAKRQQNDVLKQITKLGVIAGEVAAKEAEVAARPKTKKVLPLEKQTLGPHRFKAANIEIKLTEELVDSLRELKPEGNLFQDRFKSLQERSIIEPRVPVSKKPKYKKKHTEKHDFKRFNAANGL